MDWFRVYHDIIDDPKILQLSPEFRWFYLGILAVSSRQTVRGSLPSVTEIGIHLRVNKTKASKVVMTLIEAGLVDACPDTQKLSVHGWSKRQFKSDDVTQRWRKHNSNVGANVGKPLDQTLVKRPPRVRTETETEQRGGGAHASAGASASEDTESPPPQVLPPVWDYKQQCCIDQALRHWGASNGDVIVGELLRTFTAEIVMEAMDQCFEKFKLDLKPAYLRKCCEGKFNDHASKNGKV